MLGKDKRLKPRGQSGVQEILKRVQDDRTNHPLPQSLPRGREAEKLTSRFLLDPSLKRTYRPNVLTSYRLKKSAFTLAEVLVTLGIIGVVSAMTVPTLMQNHQRKVYVTQLHKTYNEMQQAFLMEMNEKNALNLKEAGLTSIGMMEGFIKRRFKVLESCPANEHCASIDYHNLNGDTINNNSILSWNNGACAIIASGAEICIDALLNRSDRTHTYNGYSSLYGFTFIDVNGAKGPNILGRDAFIMVNWDDGTLDTVNASPACRTKGVCDGESLEAIRNAAGAACEATKTHTDNQCIGKILNNNWEMTY